MIETAPAKLNLSLRILDEREDGFNNLEALTVFLPEISDSLTITNSGDFEIRSETVSMSADETNLVVRAMRLFSSHEKAVESGFNFEECGLLLDKIIPIAAGLGGGSADAAATLRILNTKFENLLDHTQLEQIAAWLGSDVPSCLTSEALWMKGRGEIVEQIDSFSAEDVNAVVFTPNIFCPTPLVYKKYVELGRPRDVGIDSKSLSDYVDSFHNDLSIAAFELFPNLKELKDKLSTITGLDFMLAGSGSTLFSVASIDEIEMAKNAIEHEFSREQYRLLATSSVV